MIYEIERKEVGIKNKNAGIPCGCIYIYIYIYAFLVNCKESVWQKETKLCKAPIAKIEKAHIIYNSTVTGLCKCGLVFLCPKI